MATDNTSRARVQTAMDLGEPDRVPVFCQLSVGHYFLNASHTPFDIWFRSEAFADALIELQERYRFDGILVNLPGRDPDFEREIERIEEEPDAAVVRWKDGSYTRVPRDDNPHCFQPDDSRYFPSFEELDPSQLQYVEPWEMKGLSYPHRQGEEFFPAYQLDPIKAVIDRSGGAVSIHSEVFSPFSQFLELLNYEGALVALLEDPPKVHACLQRLAEGAVDLGIRHAAAGVDAVLVSSAFAGSGFISRDHYVEFVLPYERQVVSGVQRAHPDVKVYTHTCGGIGDRLDLMLETGTQGIDTLDPPPLGTVELEDAVPQLKGRAFIKGNIDAVHTLLHGTEEAVRSAVLHCLRVAAPGGGYILSTACSVAPGVKPELLELMSDVVISEGKR